MLAQETEGAVLVKISTDVGKEIFPTRSSLRSHYNHRIMTLRVNF